MGQKWLCDLSSCRIYSRRTLIFTLVLLTAATTPLPFFASYFLHAGCSAPYVGCLAACGNKTSGGVTGGYAGGPLKQDCKAKCLAQYKTCCRGSRGGHCK
jgi:hypothetical protein